MGIRLGLLDPKTHNMTMKTVHLDEGQKILLGRILASVALTAIAWTLAGPEWLKVSIYGVAFLFAGYDVVWKALTNIIHGSLFDEHFLMAVATIGAFCIKDFPEAVAVMAFYQIGELFQNVAVDNSKRSIKELMNLKPDYALLEVNGTTERVKPEEVAKGSMIVVEPGARVPLDGIVEQGESSLDTSALTGESMPRDVAPGDKVLSGSININGVLKVRTTARYEQSTAARILKLIETADNGKAPTERFITRFARVYTPLVVALALLVFLLPPLLFHGEWLNWLNRTLIFLVISCPCALVVSIPLTFFAGIGGAARQKILVKGSTYFETLSKVRTMVFDKTGTLTQGSFRVIDIKPEGDVTKDALLRLGSLAESFSTHPVGKALKEAYQGDREAENVQEIAGEGVVATIDGKRIFAGNARLMKRAQVDIEDNPDVVGTVVYIAEQGALLGAITVGDTLKPDAAEAIRRLRKEGVERLVMLTGDRPAAAAAIAHELGITDWKASLLPQDKVLAVKEMEQSEPKDSKLAFVGDGINDAPTLATADVGIAMGALGSDAAIEAADVVLGRDSLLSLPAAVKISRRTLRIVWQNIIFAIGVKVIVMLLAALGLANMWWAVFADVGVTVLAVLNALRALRTKSA